MKQTKRIALLFIGFLPLLLFGFYLNHLISTIYYYVAGPYFLFGVAVIAAWFAFGMISILLVESKKEAVIFLNAFALLILLLLLFQEWILGSMWQNQIGLATQMFYLPLIRFGFVMGDMLPRFILPMSSFTIASAISFVFLVGASYLGRIVIESRKK